MNEAAIEQALVAAGKTAPRLTSPQIDDQIVSEQFHVFPGTTLTVCCMTLRNGFKTLGHSEAVSAENFDRKLGEDIARKHARDQIWQLEDYRVRSHLYAEEQSAQQGLL